MRDLFPEGAAGGAGAGAAGEAEEQWEEADKETAGKAVGKAAGKVTEDAAAEPAGPEEENAGGAAGATAEVAAGEAPEKPAGAEEADPEGAGGMPPGLESLARTLAKVLPAISADTEHYGEVSHHMKRVLDEGRRRRTRLLPAAIGALALFCVGAGGAGYAMLMPEDPDRAWKDYLWGRYGGEFEACVRRAVAEKAPVDCTFTFQPE